jgi:hypothetical protein
MDINCEKIVEKYLLIQNPLYAFNFPISVLCAIILFGCAKAFKWSDNSYVNQILIPILGLLLTMVLIDIISKMMISNEEKSKLVILCKQWMHDPKIKNNLKINKTINMDTIANYKLENFSNDDNIIKKKFIENINKYNESNNINLNNKQNIVESPISEIPNINPSPLEYSPNGEACIENSNCCNLCSGQNKNPCNIVAPIPGPQWMPESAEYVQNKLVNNDYTPSKCQIK